MRTRLSIFLSLSTISANASADSLEFGDSGISGPSYTVIKEQLQDLNDRYPDHARVIEYGRTVANRFMHLIRIEAPDHGVTDERPAVIITGATHGNEYLNIADRLPRELLDNRANLIGVSKFLEAGGVIYVSPILNPDGYMNDRRGNANGLDLNRDFPLLPRNRSGFSQPETRLLVEYLEADLASNNLQLRLSMDYHCCVGSLLYPWAYSRTPIRDSDARTHHVIGDIMENVFGANYRYESWYSSLGYLANGTSQDYYYAKHGTLAFTFEGRYGSEDERLPEHVEMWNLILDHLVPDRR